MIDFEGINIDICKNVPLQTNMLWEDVNNMRCILLFKLYVETGLASLLFYQI